MRKNTGYLVTFSNSSNIVCFDKRSQFQRDKKGNKVTPILHTYFILSFQRRFRIAKANIGEKKAKYQAQSQKYFRGVINRVI